MPWTVEMQFIVKKQGAGVKRQTEVSTQSPAVVSALSR
jgi:hypothetical protein